MVETGRRRRWSEDEKLKIVRELADAAPGRSDCTTIWHFALVAAAVATVISPRAQRCRRTTNGLRTSEDDPGIGGDAWFSRASRGDRDQVCGRGSTLPKPSLARSRSSTKTSIARTACTHVDYPLALPRKARVNPSSLSHLRRDRETDHLQDGMRGLFVKETMSKS